MLEHARVNPRVYACIYASVRAGVDVCMCCACGHLRACACACARVGAFARGCTHCLCSWVHLRAVACVRMCSCGCVCARLRCCIRMFVRTTVPANMRSKCARVCACAHVLVSERVCVRFSRVLRALSYLSLFSILPENKKQSIY